MTRKTVFDNMLPIGKAASWGQVTTLLIASGYSERAARDAVQSRGIESLHGFHILDEVPRLKARP